MTESSERVCECKAALIAKLDKLEAELDARYAADAEHHRESSRLRALATLFREALHQIIGASESSAHDIAKDALQKASAF